MRIESEKKERTRSNPQRDSRAYMSLSGSEPRISLRSAEDMVEERVVTIVIHLLVLWLMME